MSDARWQEAERLAARRYLTVIHRDFDPEEDDYYYIASNPEIDGCRSVGSTPAEAKQNLASARIDVIYFLLEDGLTVPEPRSYRVEVSPELPKIVTPLGEQVPEVTDSH